MDNANQSGQVDMILGLSQNSIAIAPTGKFDLADITWVSTTNSLNQQSDLGVDKSNSQIVTMDALSMPINVVDGTFIINQTTPTPSPVPTDTPTATILPTSSPSPSPSSTPIPTPIPTATPTSGPIGYGLIGNYFNGSNFQTFMSKEVDGTVNFDWGNGSPNSLIGRNNFSVRWSGFVFAPTTGNYTFYTKSDDGARLWVDDLELINNWQRHSLKENFGRINLVGGNWYPIKLEYFEATGKAAVQLLFSGPDLTKEIIPSSYLLP